MHDKYRKYLPFGSIQLQKIKCAHFRLNYNIIGETIYYLKSTGSVIAWHCKGDLILFHSCPELNLITPHEYSIFKFQ